VFDGDVYVYGYDEVPNDDTQTFVVTLENTSNGELTSELGEFFEEIRYKNTVQFVTPKKRLLEDGDIVSKAARILGAQNLRGKVEDEQGELEPLIRDERRQLRNELEDRYGKWVKWSGTPDGDGLRMRRITVDPDVEAVRDQIGRDTTYVGEKIVDTVRENDSGIRVESLLNDFLQFRRLPALLDEDVFYSAVSELQRNGDIVLEGNRANFYVGSLGQYPTEIEDEMTIHHPDNLPDAVFQESDDDDDTEDESEGGIDEWGEDESDEEDGDDADDDTSDTDDDDDDVELDDPDQVTESVEVTLKGNTSRVLRSMAESRINETTDTVEHVRLSYDVDDLSKTELIEFVEQLPDAEKIDATVVMERVLDE